MWNHQKKQNTKTGIALYIAVLIGTILMTTGLGISTIFYRELRISGFQFPSLTAFYAADTGKECALYYDGLSQQAFDNPANPATVTCAGNTQTASAASGIDGNGPFYFYGFNFTLPGDRCVHIRVKKQLIGGDVCTRITSSGENDSCGGSATVQRNVVSVDPDTCAITGN